MAATTVIVAIGVGVLLVVSAIAWWFGGEAALQTTVSITINGVVADDASNQPIDGATVKLTLLQGWTAPWERTTTTDATGQFSLGAPCTAGSSFLVELAVTHSLYHPVTASVVGQCGPIYTYTQGITMTSLASSPTPPPPGDQPPTQPGEPSTTPTPPPAGITSGIDPLLVLLVVMVGVSVIVVAVALSRLGG